MQAEIGSKIVENPLFMADHPESGSNVRKMSVAINIRESAVETLYARGQLDEAQKEAADEFRKLWERMGGSGAGAIDYSREHVDGGGARDPISIQHMQAGQELNRARETLRKSHGEYAYRLVTYIVGDGYSVHELTQTRRQRDTMTDMLRMYLDVLAHMWRFSNSPMGKRRETGT